MSRDCPPHRVWPPEDPTAKCIDCGMTNAEIDSAAAAERTEAAEERIDNLETRVERLEEQLADVLRRLPREE